MKPSETAYARRIAFTRTKTGNGFLSWPTIRFSLKREDGSDIGALTLRGRDATYHSAANPQADIRLKKGFWGHTWLYAGDGSRVFGRLRFGWNFRPSFVFRDSERYFLRVKRRFRFSARKPGDASQAATFTREAVPVMLMQNFAPMPFFSNEVTAAMSGVIQTNVTEDRVMAGLLILFQSFLDMRNRSSH